MNAATFAEAVSVDVGPVEGVTSEVGWDGAAVPGAVAVEDSADVRVWFEAAMGSDGAHALHIRAAAKTSSESLLALGQVADVSKSATDIGHPQSTNRSSSGSHGP